MAKGKLEITAEEFLLKFKFGDIYILDVRNEEEHGAWPIQWSDSFSGINIPYFTLIEDFDKYTEGVPKDKEVIVICATGNASEYIAQTLVENGYSAKSVYRGMKAWASVYVNNVVFSQDGYSIVQFNRVAKGCLSYAILSDNEAIIIDPSRHIDQYLDYLDEKGYTLKYIFDTHLHADHISGANDLSKVSGEYYINDNDMAGAKISYRVFGDDQVFKVGSKSVELITLYAPGHTPGSSCILFDNKYLFTGDLLFISSMGRPDLGGKAKLWVKDLWNSVNLLSRFSDDVIILPSHTSGGAECDKDARVFKSLGDIRRFNNLLTLKESNKFCDIVLSNIPDEPKEYQEIRKVNLGILCPDEDTKEEYELGQNRCAVSQVNVK